MKTVKLKSDKELAFHEARSLANKEAIKYTRPYDIELVESKNRPTFTRC